MTQREKLIELLRETFDYTRGVCIDFDEAVEINADHLLESGVIVPPCKVGDTVYVLMKKAMPDYEYKEGVNEITVRHIRIRSDGIIVSDFWGFIDFIFGKRAFLTREEAEKALAERSGK